MNLIDERWIPVRRQDGSHGRISPLQLSDPAVAAFDAERADFNGALAQLAIGLLQTTTPAETGLQWRRLLQSPPDEATLGEWFAPHTDAFEFDGPGARFMQDFDLRSGDGEPVGIGGLLIEAPGENAVKNNSDLFIKRNQVQRLCPHCAALALFTLQVNAPAGGAGHRTGLRGGGPLTTLLVAQGNAGAPLSLWHTLWLNVIDQLTFQGAAGDSSKTAPHFTFPWCAAIGAIQKEGGQTAPPQVHPAHVCWAMPRRIRLDMDAPTSGICDLCGITSDALIERYVTRNYGLNYKGPWRHPLSPYYLGKEGLLPMHPQPDGLGYRHWAAWVLGMQTDKRTVERAPAIEHFLRDENRIGMPLRLWAFGYDMDNMKARCWYDSTVPLYALANCSVAAQKALREDVTAWLAGAELAVSYLRGAVKDAWFSGDARGDFGFVDATFWSLTEAAFYTLLRQHIEPGTAAAIAPDRNTITEAWMLQLIRCAERLFDSEWVGSGPVERMNPARIAAAFKQLKANLRGPKLRTALALPVAPKPLKNSGKKVKTPLPAA